MMMLYSLQYLAVDCGLLQSSDCSINSHFGLKQSH